MYQLVSFLCVVLKLLSKKKIQARGGQCGGKQQGERGKGKGEKDKGKHKKK